MTKLETAWSHPDVVTITPIDDGIGTGTFGNWLVTLKPVWLPVLFDGEMVCEAFETSERIGISITENLARMWGAGSDEKQYEKISSDLNPIVVLESNQVAVFAKGLTPGSTISTANSSAVLVAPTF